MRDDNRPAIGSTHTREKFIGGDTKDPKVRLRWDTDNQGRVPRVIAGWTRAGEATTSGVFAERAARHAAWIERNR